MKPQYQFFKNFAYARAGLKAVFLEEKSFRLEVVFFVILSVTALILPYPAWAKIVLIASMLVPLAAELLNSALEGVVDMITEEYDERAKYAKDAAAAGVMLSLIFSAMIWIGFIIYFC